MTKLEFVKRVKDQYIRDIKTFVDTGDNPNVSGLCSIILVVCFELGVSLDISSSVKGELKELRTTQNYNMFWFYNAEERLEALDKLIAKYS